MVSAGVCFEGKGRLHFIDEKAKVNTGHYINALLPKLLEDCHDLMGDNIFQQDGAPARSEVDAAMAQRALPRLH